MNIKYLPTEENQDYPDFQTWACTNYSICNLFETYLNYQMCNNLLSDETLQFLIDNGYIVKR